MSPRVKCLALLALLAVSFAAVSSAARPDPASSGGAASTAQSQPQSKVGEDCGGGGVGAEECLMRRTLEAHLDYIYTQNHHH
ncbi:phytosulfokines 4-like isoform X1 [Rhodamnia argentea]|uniref:Phytosulfokine n=1 Tax=Rhodamnia argentea TaxID=178133 RepID=A0ABM3HE13_9MYRT|nr:phytosulfokines 4-like isoform X1 [Rhodamnia argentea]